MVAALMHRSIVTTSSMDDGPVIRRQHKLDHDWYHPRVGYGIAADMLVAGTSKHKDQNASGRL